MYGIVHSGIIEHTALKKHIQQFGYEPAPITPKFWSHNNNGITFTLMLNKTGIKYKRKEDALPLIHEL